MTENRKDWNLTGGIKDPKFRDYLVEYLKIFKELEIQVEYNDYFKSYYLVGSLPIEHNPDYIMGIVHGIEHEHNRMTNGKI